MEKHVKTVALLPVPAKAVDASANRVTLAPTAKTEFHAQSASATVSANMVEQLQEF